MEQEVLERLARIEAILTRMEAVPDRLSRLEGIVEQLRQRLDGSNGYIIARLPLRDRVGVAAAIGAAAMVLGSLARVLGWW